MHLESSNQSASGSQRNRPTLRPQPKTATQSGTTQVDWIIDLVAGLESPPLSLRTSPARLFSNQLHPILSFKNRIFSTHELYILEQSSQQSSSSRNRALLTGLISLILSLSQSPFVTELPPNLTLLRLCDITHHRRPYPYLNIQPHTRVF